MKIPALPCLALLILTLTSLLRADDSATIAAVTAADNSRVAAMIAVDPAALAESFSADLHYAHSNGVIDTKASYIDSLTSKKSIYVGVEYQARDFSVAAPGIVLMKGRTLIKAGNNDMINLIDLNYLAVWRLENGRWRFLAWQSCRNGPPTHLGPPTPIPPSNARTSISTN